MGVAGWGLGASGRHARKRSGEGSGTVPLWLDGGADPGGPPVASSAAAGGCGAAFDEPGVRRPVCEARPALDTTGAAAAGAAAAGVLLGSQRTPADGTDRVQPAVPLVRGDGLVRTGVESRGVQQEPAAAAEPGVGQSFFTRVKEQAAGLMSDEHFTVDGTLIEAWAGHKSFRPKQGPGSGSASGE